MDASETEGWRGQRRERLLQAAARVFARHAYESASMDEIAHEAGVGKPTLYRYYPSKDALFVAVFVDALDTLEERLAGVLDEHPGLPERLRGLVLAITPTFRDHLVPVRLLDDGAAALDASRRRIFRERRDRIARYLTRAIEDGAGRGDVRWDVDPSRVAEMTIGMIWSAAAALRTSDDEIARDVAALILHGIATPCLHPAGANGSPHAMKSDVVKGTGRGRSREAASA